MAVANFFPARPILLIDDEEGWLNSFSLKLRAAGINNILTCTDSRKTMEIMAGEPVGVLVLDLTMPHLSGEELLPRVVENYPDVPVIIITGLDLVETAVNCMKLGAYDFFTKVSEEERLINGIRRAIDLGRLRGEHETLKKHFLHDTLDHPEVFAPIVTHNRGMRAVFQYVEAIAGTGEPVLITGETGVGKELIAGAIHRLSGRKGKFVPVNIAGLDDNMVADALFGHVKGAFTGADRARPGLVENAAAGTLFIDEIGDLTGSSQVKLLRLIQEREFMPLGADLAKRTDCRMIFATHRSLAAMHNNGDFRRDLLYRLRTHHLEVPPLRERLDDLPVLLDHFLAEAARELNRNKPAYPPELISLLSTYDFPGNIRELRNMVIDALSRQDSTTIGMEHFKRQIRIQRELDPKLDSTDDEAVAATPFSGLKTLPPLKEVGNILISEALRRTNNNQRLAAEMLGITRQALNWRLKKDSSPDDR
ncbi:MAG: sigma-54 dependent transcriptional regulator [Desulfurivibrionaceae bacterium]|nr:sigma-54 dependent transcriptional regulator [Desulfurivibrionaceae bacterium]